VTTGVADWACWLFDGSPATANLPSVVAQSGQVNPTNRPIAKAHGWKPWTRAESRDLVQVTTRDRRLTRATGCHRERLLGEAWPCRDPWPISSLAWPLWADSAVSRF